MRCAEAIPPEPPSLARPMWRATSGEVGVASIPLVGPSEPQPIAGHHLWGGFAKPATCPSQDRGPVFFRRYIARVRWYPQAIQPGAAAQYSVWSTSGARLGVGQ